MYLHWGINDKEKTRKRSMSKLHKERQCPETWLVLVMWLPEINGWKRGSLMSVVPSGKPQVASWLSDVQVRKTTGISLRSTLCTGKGLKLAPHNCPWSKDPPPTSKTSQFYQTSQGVMWQMEILLGLKTRVPTCMFMIAMHAFLWRTHSTSTQLYGGHPP